MLLLRNLESFAFMKVCLVMVAAAVRECDLTEMDKVAWVPAWPSIDVVEASLWEWELGSFCL